MSTTTTSPPSRRTACAISAPTGPPPRMTRRCGIAFIDVTSRLVQTPSSSRKPGTGGIDRVGAVREHHVVGRVPDAVDLDDPRAGEPAAAAYQVDSVVGQPVAPARRRSSRRP